MANMHEHEVQRNSVSRGQILLVAPSASGGQGAWLSDLAEPYVKLRKCGYDVTIATPKGGQVPVDPASQAEAQASEPIKTFLNDGNAAQMMKSSVSLDKVENIKAYVAMFLAGGTGAAQEFSAQPKLTTLVHQAFREGVLVAALGDANAVFASADGSQLVSGKRVAVPRDQEEGGAQLESKLKEAGAQVVSGEVGSESVIADGNILTGQNHASAAKLAALLIEALDAQCPAGAPADTLPSPRHPGTMTAAEAPQVLGVAPIVHHPSGDVPMGDAGPGEPSYDDNLGPMAQASPAAYSNNEASAAG